MQDKQIDICITCKDEKEGEYYGASDNTFFMCDNCSQEAINDSELYLNSVAETTTKIVEKR